MMAVPQLLQTPSSRQVFKLKFLLPYLDRLLRLADNKTLREELTAFPLAVRWVGGWRMQGGWEIQGHSRRCG